MRHFITALICGLCFVAVDVALADHKDNPSPNHDGGTCTEVIVEDVNANGVVTAVDALQVLNVAALITEPTVIEVQECTDCDSDSDSDSDSD